jgi:hypothetical protein
MKIKLPKSIKELRLYHLQALAEIDLENMQIYDKAVLAHKLTSIDLETIKRISIQHINEIIDHYSNLIIKVKKEDPPKTIEVEGRRYNRIKSISEMPMSWHIDRQISQLKDSAVVSAFVYLEDGLEYCETDKTGNILNPLTPRIEFFRENLSADVLIQVGFFFEKKSESYTIDLEEINKQRTILSKKKEERERKKEERRQRKKAS